MKVFLGSDHHGIKLKEEIYYYLEKKYDVILINKTETMDLYPNIAVLMAKTIQKNPSSKGILICKTGIGMQIVSNKYKGVYANNCRDINECYYFRKCNNGNILCLGTDFLTTQEAIDICCVFLKTEFDEKNAFRLELINKLI